MLPAEGRDGVGGELGSTQWGQEPTVRDREGRDVCIRKNRDSLEPLPLTMDSQCVLQVLCDAKLVLVGQKSLNIQKFELLRLQNRTLMRERQRHHEPPPHTNYGGDQENVVGWSRRKAATKHDAKQTTIQRQPPATDNLMRHKAQMKDSLVHLFCGQMGHDFCVFVPQSL